MGKNGLLRSLALGVTSVALGCAAVAFTAAAPAGAAEPLAKTCTSETALIRLLSPTPGCRVTVECPAESAGCAFSASVKAQSAITVATAQAKLRIVHVGSGNSTIFTCSAPAALLATGSGAGCSTPSIVSFAPAGTTYTAICSWTGSTVSVSARVTCSAAFALLGGE